ncbi:MAG: thiazole synthase [Terriglobales bacterium]
MSPAASALSADPAAAEDWALAGRTFRSRLIVGTGKYASFEQTAACVRLAGAGMVTVAVRRVNITRREEQNLLDYLDLDQVHILPNTAGCYTAEDAVRTARLSREALDNPWIKLEVIGDPDTLFPDTTALLEATRLLVREGFIVLPYTSDDLIVAQRLVDAGAAAVMPLAAPIGSGLGIQNPTALRILREKITAVPLIVDAGVGCASDAAWAMELGADAVLMNTAIAAAREPERMARAMQLAIAAGRASYLAGRMPERLYASPSSPAAGKIA